MGQCAGSFDELWVVEESEGLGRGVGDGAAGGAFLSRRRIEGEHGGMDVLAFPEGVERTLVLFLAGVGFPDLVTRTEHHFVGLGPVGIGLIGEEGFGGDLFGEREKSGGEEGRVADFFGVVAMPSLSCVQTVGGIHLGEFVSRDGGKLVGFRGDEETDHVPDVPI